ncbi:MAG: beta-3-deoxy-D-manno-oct-2-ulosonic acid transferase [Sandaracinus sp.]|nr:beta-3-deoxy-D-manno-oct-2-ulosonic acid transferase [Sandaracinus sp.]
MMEPPQPRTVGIWSPGVRRVPHLAAFLGAERLRFRPLLRSVEAWAGWGRKPNTARPRARARREGVPYLGLEDGFLRSVRRGAAEPPLSLVVDDVGIYYDATRPSRLERWLAEDDFEGGELARAEALIRQLRKTGLSKYNHQPDLDLGPKKRERVLVVDQTAGDQSLRLGLCAVDFEALLETARREHPDAEIVVKTHPDVLAGAKRGHLERAGGVRVVAEPAHPASLLAQVDRVWVMTSQMGFEALVHGLPVTCFGVPWYAGWGLTDDRGAIPPRRGRTRSLTELVAAAYLRYARYLDPETGERCEVERVVEHLDVQRRCGQATRGTVVCVGFSAWKRGFLPAFLEGPETRVRFAANARKAAPHLGQGGRLVVWGTGRDHELASVARQRDVPIWRMEDGFLRSVGLGSDLYAPASLVLDQRGLYYDPATPSDLEVLLQEAEFDETELARAARLRQRIVASGLSKYNVGRRRPVAERATNRYVVLVIGQVEDDASIRLGCLDVRRNEELLREARRARPDAFVVYKPHPDVVSGNRRGEIPPATEATLADEVVRHAALADCLAVADEVHTMTSLVGFEALLRELPVVAYGQPFYAGWGLTEDRHPHPRRTRRRTLDELVAAALLRYPRYVSRVTDRYTTPEVVIDQLLEARGGPDSRLLRSWPARQLRKGRNVARYGLRSLSLQLREVLHHDR